MHITLIFGQILSSWTKPTKAWLSDRSKDSFPVVWGVLEWFYACRLNLLNMFNIYCKIYCFEILLCAGNTEESRVHTLNNSQLENKLTDDGNTRSKTDSKADSEA